MNNGKKIRIGDQEHSALKWAELLGVTRAAFYYRVKKFGETIEQSISHFIAGKEEYREDKLRIAWNIYREWLEYNATGDGKFKNFEQWLLNELTKEEARC